MPKHGLIIAAIVCAFVIRVECVALPDVGLLYAVLKMPSTAPLALPLTAQQKLLCNLHWQYRTDLQRYQQDTAQMNAIQRQSAPLAPTLFDYTERFAEQIGASGQVSDWVGYINVVQVVTPAINASLVNANAANPANPANPKQVEIEVIFGCPDPLIINGVRYIQDIKLDSEDAIALDPQQKERLQEGYFGVPLGSSVAQTLAAIPNDGKYHYVKVSGNFLYLPVRPGNPYSGFADYHGDGTAAIGAAPLLLFRFTSISLFDPTRKTAGKPKKTPPKYPQKITARLLQDVVDANNKVTTQDVTGKRVTVYAGQKIALRVVLTQKNTLSGHWSITDGSGAAADVFGPWNPTFVWNADHTGGLSSESDAPTPVPMSNQGASTKFYWDLAGTYTVSHDYKNAGHATQTAQHTVSATFIVRAPTLRQDQLFIYPQPRPSVTSIPLAARGILSKAVPSKTWIFSCGRRIDDKDLPIILDQERLSGSDIDSEVVPRGRGALFSVPRVVDEPLKYKGTYEWVQIVEKRIDTNNHNPMQTAPTNPTGEAIYPGLDEVYPYAGHDNLTAKPNPDQKPSPDLHDYHALFTMDTPSAAFDSKATQIIDPLVWVKLDFSATMYLLWEPILPDATYVPLGSVKWSCDLTARRRTSSGMGINEEWDIDPEPQIRPSAGPTAYPVWTHIVTP